MSNFIKSCRHIRSMVPINAGGFKIGLLSCWGLLNLANLTACVLDPAFTAQPNHGEPVNSQPTKEAANSQSGSQINSVDSYAYNLNYPVFSMPQDMPLMEDAGNREVLEGGRQVSYTTIASFTEIKHIYTVRLAQYGWYEQIEQTQHTDDYLFMWFAHPARANVLHLRATNTNDRRAGEIRSTMLRMD